MADPYAARAGGSVGERPAEGSTLRAALERRGGFVACSLTELAEAPSAGVAFIAALVRDESLLPPLARVDGPFAVALLLRGGDDGATASRAIDAVERARVDVFAVAEGTVAGPAGAPGAEAIAGELIESVLAAALAGDVEWERDPDFGYDIPARVPGVEGAAADALCPRLLYAAADRVYEYAEGVVAVKRDRHRRAAAVRDLDPRLLAATGWPAEPTGQEWKD
jgi:hypothetical protein